MQTSIIGRSLSTHSQNLEQIIPTVSGRGTVLEFPTPLKLSVLYVHRVDLLIDEFETTSKTYAKSSNLKIIINKENARAKEDGSRLEGTSGDSIVYQLPAQMTYIQIDAFFTTGNREKDLQFSSGISKETAIPLHATREIFEVFNNAYRAFTPVRYTVKDIPKDHRYIVIYLKEGIQLGRLEIGYDPE